MKHKNCGNRVTNPEEEGVRLWEEIKDTKASIKSKNDDLKNKQAKALKAMKETHTSQVNSLETSLKNKNQGISKSEEKV